MTSHEKSFLLYGGVIVAFLLVEGFGKKNIKSADIVWGAILGAAAVEAVKAFGRTQGASHS